MHSGTNIAPKLATQSEEFSSGLAVLDDTEIDAVSSGYAGVVLAVAVAVTIYRCREYLIEKMT